MKIPKKTRRFIFLTIMLVLLAVVTTAGVGLAGKTSPSSPAAGTNAGYLPPEGINSRNALLIRLKDDAVLYKKDADKKIYPASMTKIMTAVVALENISDLDEKIVLPEYIFTGLYARNASMAGFYPNELVTVRDLLYGSLLPSGAEASTVLAIAACGSEDKFVGKMNEKAASLGMSNTKYVNVTGLHEKNHYSTVTDIAILLQYALGNATFKEAYTTARYTTVSTSAHPGGITLNNTMYKKFDNLMLDKGEIKGGKTGYTKEAGLCLASLAVVDGSEYILITAGAPGNGNTQQFNIIDAINIYNQI